MASKKYGSGRYSPNQEFRRDEVIDSACEILRERGVSGVSVRSVAEKAGLSSGAIHYYFRDIQELLDLAYDKLTDRYFARISAFSRAIEDPAGSFWHTVLSYIQPWSAHSSMPLLWCEYYVTSVRSGRIEGVRNSQRRTVSMFEAAMATSGLQFAVSAEGLFRHANGAVLSMTLIPASIDTLIGELAQLLGVPKPMSDVFACRNPSCKLCAIEAKAQFAATDATQH